MVGTVRRDKIGADYIRDDRSEIRKIYGSRNPGFGNRSASSFGGTGVSGGGGTNFLPITGGELTGGLGNKLYLRRIEDGEIDISNMDNGISYVHLSGAPDAVLHTISGKIHDGQILRMQGTLTLSYGIKNRTVENGNVVGNIETKNGTDIVLDDGDITDFQYDQTSNAWRQVGVVRSQLGGVDLENVMSDILPDETNTRGIGNNDKVWSEVFGRDVHVRRTLVMSSSENARVNGDLIPLINNRNDLGSNTRTWNDIFADNHHVRNQLIMSSSDSARVIGDLIPFSNNSNDLGSSSRVWSDVFATNHHVEGTLVMDSDSRTVGNILPLINNRYDLGSNTRTWNDIFADNHHVRNQLIMSSSDSARVIGDMIPLLNDLYDIGSSTRRWSQGWFDFLETDDLRTDEIRNTAGSTSSTGSDIEIMSPVSFRNPPKFTRTAANPSTTATPARSVVIRLGNIEYKIPFYSLNA